MVLGNADPQMRRALLVAEGPAHGRRTNPLPTRAFVHVARGNKQLIDIESVANRLGRRVVQRRNEWVMSSRSQVLAASGQLFEARDEVLAFIAMEDAAENDAAK